MEKTPILILENSQLHSVVIGINEITTEGQNVTEDDEEQSLKERLHLKEK